MPVTEAENLTLHYLRRLDDKVDRLVVDMREVKERIGNLEHQGVSLERRYALLSTRMDQVDIRLDRIERRLDLISPG